MRFPGRGRLLLALAAMAALWPGPGAAIAQTTASDGLSVVIQHPLNNTDVATLGVVLSDIPLVIAYSAPAGVDKLEVWVDAKLQLADTIPGERDGSRSYLWDVTLHGPGAHKIAAVVHSGTQSARAEVTVTYGAAPAGPPTGPTVRFTSPAEGQVITGVTTFDVQVDGVTPKWVMFLLDEHQVGTRIGAPLSMSFDTSGYADGAHALQAIVRTEDGKQLDSDILHVVFSNSSVPVIHDGTGTGTAPALPKGALVVVPPIDPNLIQSSSTGVAPTGGLVVPPPAPEFTIAEPTSGSAPTGASSGSGGLPPLESEMAGGTGGPAPPGGGWKPLDHGAASGTGPGPAHTSDGSVRPLAPDLAGPGGAAAWRSLGAPPPAGSSQLPELQPGMADEAPTTVETGGARSHLSSPPSDHGPAGNGPSILEPELAGPEGEQTHAVPVRSAVSGAGTSTPPAIGPGPPAERDIAVLVGMSEKPLNSRGVVRGELLLVPLRALTEALSGRCAVDASTGEVVAEFQGTAVSVCAGSDAGKRGEADVHLECPAEDRGGVLYVPFSLLRDLWGLSVTVSPDGGTAEVMFIPEPGVE